MEEDEEKNTREDFKHNICIFSNFFQGRRRPPIPPHKTLMEYTVSTTYPNQTTVTSGGGWPLLPYAMGKTLYLYLGFAWVIPPTSQPDRLYCTAVVTDFSLLPYFSYGVCSIYPFNIVVVTPISMAPLCRLNPPPPSLPLLLLLNILWIQIWK